MNLSKTGMLTAQRVSLGSRQSPMAFAAGLLLLTAVAWVTCAFGEMAPDSPETGLGAGQGEAILQELREIRRLLEKIERQGGPARPAPRRGPPPTATVSVKDRPMLGQADAPVTVVEFTDFQCPFCRRFIDGSFPGLKDKYIATGKVRWVVRDLPLGFHANARKAAQAAHCAGDQGKYWEMRELLFQNNRDLGEDKLPEYAAQLQLEASGFRACLEGDKHLDQIDADLKMAEAVGITGTPSFVIGPTGEGDTVSGRLVVGAQAPRVFEAEIDKLIGESVPPKGDGP